MTLVFYKKKKVVMRKTLSLLFVCIALVFNTIHIANAKEVLPEYPLLKVIEYNWANDDYTKKNTVEHKTAISNKFLKVLNEEEKVVEKFLNSKAPQSDKDKAFLKHMHNVQVVATDLSEVVDWIIFEELEYQFRPHILNKTFYGIEYQFSEHSVGIVGEYLYNAKIVKYPMIELEWSYRAPSTELHTQAKRVNAYYINKYKNNISDVAINMLNRDTDLSLLDYEAQKGVMDYLIIIILFVFAIVVAIVVFKHIPIDKIKESIQNFITKSREKAAKIREEYNRTHCKYCGAKFVNDQSQFCSKCGNSRE